MNTIKQSGRVFDTQQKITAVLSILSERRTSAKLCQEMEISPSLLGQWQNLLIMGMLRALWTPRRRKRESLYRWIQELAAELATQAGKTVITPAAWRVAARQWLLQNGLIRIRKAGEVSPIFSEKRS
jgi:hypothetical protein